MSLATDRAAIAAALDAVTDITGYDDQPSMLSPGDAWVRWGGFDAAGPVLTFMTIWRIWVVCGGTPQDAMTFLDTHLADVLDAIDQLVYVTGVQPVEIQISGGVTYGAEITAQKES